VRILLTGDADVSAAVKAVNDGQIFRFLSKPCEVQVIRTALDDAVKYHELLTGERQLLQKTLLGAIKAMADIMSLASPTVAGRALRLRRRVAALASLLGVEERWQLEAAALLSYLGHVSLPTFLTEKLIRGVEVEPELAARARNSIRAANRVIARVPRLERVSAILRAVLEDKDTTDPVMERRFKGPTADPVHVQLLNLAIQTDRLESERLCPESIRETLAASGAYPPAMLDALAAILLERENPRRRAQIAIGSVRVGMVLDEDLKTARDILVAPRGCEVTASFLQHIRSVSTQLPERVTVLLREAS
jgi:hypothetical protein